MAAAILHDIGKLRELKYDPVETRYTTEGRLIGHVMFGRDMVHEAAGKIEGFPPETLMLLEHAILAHHGKKEFGAPILPQTLEALLVHHIDELDAKMNMVARKRLSSTTDDAFTDYVKALDNRRFYKGIPAEGPGDDGPPALD
jgi:3'-5' exoribonuclease